MIQPSHHFILWLRALLLGSVGVGWVLSAQAAGTGLNGEYFDNVDFTVKQLERLEGSVQFDWGLESPTPALGSDTFSVRWSGQVEADYSETYTLYVVADDGARLWVNERLVAARTIPGSGVVEVSGTASLHAGLRYNLVLEFEEHAGPAEVRLEWSSPSQARQVIPRERLYPKTASPRTGGVRMEFWSGLPGTETTALTSHPRFPDRPNGREFPIAFECLTTNWTDDYGTRVKGVSPSQRGQRGQSENQRGQSENQRIGYSPLVDSSRLRHRTNSQLRLRVTSLTAQVTRVSCPMFNRSASQRLPTTVRLLSHRARTCFMGGPLGLFATFRDPTPRSSTRRLVRLRPPERARPARHPPPRTPFACLAAPDPIRPTTDPETPRRLRDIPALMT